ncbi:Origin recognition complex subunit 5 [Pleurostoma richardsiae]|uniref:Origin recognition complex subunit 5 n=1 Tax=Pleurostoma richardsiae TaxID=41990 RepID=A0AA38RHK5_9PEZI|nr:Origin recognition complex subunit 5 [Pleurostoma richardsiae]
MSSLYQLPDEVLQSVLVNRFLSREKQIQALATLLHPNATSCRNLVVHGTEATGKSAVVSALLECLATGTDSNHRPSYAIIDSVECVTGRHLFEKTLAKVVQEVQWESTPSRCENVSQLAFELSKILKYTAPRDDRRFVLVFDGIDRQREAPLTLLPALARLSEIIPSLTTVFIVTSPPPSLLRTSFVPHVQFPNYTKPELVAILSAMPPPTLPMTTKQETTDLWSRFGAAVYDALTKAASRTLPAFVDACNALWPRFTAPILAGTYKPREFPRLLVAARVHFQDESLLDPGIIATSRKPVPGPPRGNENATTLGMPSKPLPIAPSPTDLSTLLPPTARLLLLAAYLASHNAPRHDVTLFSTYHHGQRRWRPGGVPAFGGGAGRRGPQRKHRKIARKLLGAHAFVLERMMAIFIALCVERGAPEDGTGMDTDVGMAIATLSTLHLLMRVGGGDPLDRGGKWRVNVGWEVVRGLGRSMGIEIDEWLID